MPESVVVQVGQCGNQIGTRFWLWALEEALNSCKVGKAMPSGVKDLAVDAFFSVEETTSARKRSSGDDTVSLKARAVLVDMEEGVINSALREPRIGRLFDSRLQVTDVSGSGNNWACGYYEYGLTHGGRIVEALRHAAEACDCLQNFFLLHSMGGGTGSGLGSYILDLCAENFPEVDKFIFPVYPCHENDDVVTSPYNSVLATRHLIQSATCVFPVDNGSLLNIATRHKLEAPLTKERCLLSSNSVNSKTKKNVAGPQKPKPFDVMNDIVAQLFLNLTGCARFSGPLNLDLSDIETNMVPYPRLRFILASQAPIAGSTWPMSKRPDNLFDEALGPSNQVYDVDSRTSGYCVANALLCRGAGIKASDIRAGIDKLSKKLRFVPWNPDAWKTGQCSYPPLHSPVVALGLVNTTAIVKPLVSLRRSFEQLYAHKAYFHHYERAGVEPLEIASALESLNGVIEDYKEAEVDYTARK